MSIYTKYLDPTSPESLTRGSSSASSAPSSSILPVTPIDENDTCLYAPTPPPKEIISSILRSRSPSNSSLLGSTQLYETIQPPPSHRRTRSAREVIQEFEAMDAKLLPPKNIDGTKRTSLLQRPRLDVRRTTASALGTSAEYKDSPTTTHSSQVHSPIISTRSPSDHANESKARTSDRSKSPYATNHQEKAPTTEKGYRLPRLLSPLSRARVRTQIPQRRNANSDKSPASPVIGHRLKTSIPSTSMTSFGSIKTSAMKPSTSSSSAGISGVKNSFQALLNVFGGGKRKRKARNAEEFNEGEIGFTVDRSGKAIAIRPFAANVRFCSTPSRLISSRLFADAGGPTVSVFPNNNFSYQSGGAKTGYLAHLATNKASWAQCIAILDPPYLTLTPRSSSSSSTNELNSSISVTRLFDLSSCSNTRTISDGRLGPGTPKPILPNYEGGDEGDADDAYVFEIELDGGVREFFASRTLKDRGAWVSAIWDIIISRPSQDHCVNSRTPVLPSPEIGGDTGTGTPTMLDGDLGLQPPLRVVNGAASRLSGNSSIYEETLRKHQEQSISPQDDTISSPGSYAMTGSSAVESGITSMTGYFYDREDITSANDLLTATSYLSPILDSDEELPYPVPERLRQSKFDADTVRARSGIELNDGDDYTESWRPSNSQTNPSSSSRSNDTPSHEILYNNVPPSASLSPFARRRMSKNSKAASPVSPTSLFPSGISADETNGTLTPSTLAAGISKMHSEHSVNAPQTNLPSLPRKDQALPSIHQIIDRTVLPSESEGESRRNYRNPDPVSSNQIHGKLETIIAMLGELLHRSDSSVAANAPAIGSLETKLDEMALLLNSVVSRFNNIEPTAFSNLLPRQPTVLEDDGTTAKTILERVDKIHTTLQTYRSEHVKSMNRFSEKASKAVGLDIIVERLDDLKLSQRFPPPPTGEMTPTNELASIHAKLDDLLTSLPQRAVEGTRKGDDLLGTSQEHSTSSVVSDHQPTVPLQRSLSVFDARGRRELKTSTLPSVEVSETRRKR